MIEKFTNYKEHYDKVHKEKIKELKSLKFPNGNSTIGITFNLSVLMKTFVLLMAKYPLSCKKYFLIHHVILK